MPTYDYHCSTCGTEFELFQSFSEDTLKKCPTKKSGNSPAGCTSPGKGKVTKVFSAPGITFKGSGFYKTDSRGASGSGSDKSDKSESSTTSDSSSDSTSKSTDSTKKSDSTAKSTTSSSSD
jgi:predicted nucleic acid-binding Zn ribbon protein